MAANNFHLEYEEKFRKQLRKIDKNHAARIMVWLDQNVENCANPRLYGKALAGKLAGLWRYRVGDYRVICVIEDRRLVVLALEVGHRREIYK